MPLKKIAKTLAVDCQQLEYLQALTEEEAARLQDQLRHAKRAQYAHVSEATQAAVSQLPALLRKPVLKILGG